MQLYERGKVAFAEVAEITEDIVAEAKAELSESTAAATAAATPVKGETAAS
jgi:hypothetical protein